MFTGLVQALGQVTKFERSGDHAVIRIKSSEIAAELAVGDSVRFAGTVRPNEISFSSAKSKVLVQSK